MPDASNAMGARWSGVPRFARFLLVGGLNAAFGYGTYALLLFIGLDYATATLVATVIAVCFNFVTTGSLVFADRSPAAIVRFVAVYAVIYLLNVALLALFARAGIGPYLAGALCLVPMAGVSYLLMRRFVFGGDHAAR